MNLISRLRPTLASLLQGPAKPVHPALQLPEVLERILCFLSQATLRRSSVLVCHQWNAVAKLFIVQTLDWTVQDNSTANGFKEGLERLALTHVLKCQQWNLAGPNRRDVNSQERWNQLMSSTRMLCSEKPLLVRELRIPFAADVALQTIPLLEMLPALTMLRLENIRSPSTIPVGDILSLCPNLLHLTLESLRQRQTSFRSGDVLSAEPADLVLPTSSSLPGQLKLKTLELHYICIQPSVLETLLRSCNDLERLRLSLVHERRLLVHGHFNPGESPLIALDWTQLFDQTEQICPKLESIHLSKCRGVFWSNPEMRGLAEWFPLLNEAGGCDDTLQPAFLRHLSREFDTLTTLVIDTRMHNSSWEAATVTFGETLHRFLCDAPHLLHLRAGEVPLWINDLDVEQVANASGSYHRSTDKVPVPLVPPRVWACRNLRTLHLGFARRGVDHGTDLNSRLIFDYVSRVCPLLEDVSIWRRMMRMGITGGLCLLTRLKRLKRLRLRTSVLSGVLLLDRDVDWMARTRPDLAFLERRRRLTWVQRLIQLETGFLRKTSVAHQLELLESNGEDSGHCFVGGVDMTRLGWPFEALEVAKNQLDRQGLCWPDLESIEFVYENVTRGSMGGSELALKGLLKKHRPDVQLIWTVI